MTHQPKFCSAFITHISKETPYARHLNLKLADSSIQQSYKTPGQYTLVRIPEFKEGYFALTNHPENKEWSLLVKADSPLSTHILGLTYGNTFQVSSVQGKGFDMNCCRGKNLLLFAAGTGIAPIRAALLWMIKKRSEYKEITLFYGARNQNEFAYQNEFKEWEKGEIKIVQTISNQTDKSWKGPLGHVQQHVKEGLEMKNSVALLCGMPEMIEDATKQLTTFGLPKDQILTND